MNKNKRQIKFRVWYQNEYLKPYAYLLGNTGEIYWVLGYHRYELVENQKDFVIEQFTGLVDKNGVEIYEGDIIGYTQCLFNTNPEQYPIRTKGVRFDELTGKWNVYETRAGELGIEVIGNTHQNPEFLKI